MSKAEIAVEIYNEELAKGEEGLRKRCIDRFKAELSMGDAGASTYFQNTKKKAAGEKVTHYRPKPKSNVEPTDKKVDDSKESQALWSRYDTDHNGIVTAVDCYTTQEAAIEALKQKGGYATTDTQEVNIGDCIK